MSCLILKLTTVKLLFLCFRLQTGILGRENGPDVVTVIVKQGSDVILPCSLSTKDDITSKLFDWMKDGRDVFMYDGGDHYNNGRSGQDDHYKGRVSHFPGELKSGNASIIIQNTRMEDGGDYTCDFPRLQPGQKFHIKLVVGTAPKPYVTSPHQTADLALLQCQVRGAFPKPKLHWQDRAGNILHAEEPKVTEREGRYDIILQTTVNKTNYYRCVATQEEISHQVDTETFVFISGAASKPYITLVDVTEDGVQLKCEVRDAFPQPKLRWQDSDGNIFPAEERQVSERGGHYNVSLYSTVTSTTTNRFSCVVKQEDIGHIVNAEITLLDKLFEDKSCPVAGAWIGGWFSGALTVAAVLALFEVAKYIMKYCKKDSPQTNGSYTIPSTQPLKPPV
ncbi:butyrophilin-like protein 2 isoform X2 [Thunnus thynnus]|uniref:butyrophilin-like protein 2 isoform X2 n=1 Tax=Thunnus thynnus TaxID=8237 RepID=UPI003527BC4D